MILSGSVSRLCRLPRARATALSALYLHKPQGLSVQGTRRQTVARSTGSKAVTMPKAEKARVPDKDYTDVTSSNYRQMLPDIKLALQQCSYYAFDLEMSGLFLDHHKSEYLDEPQDRWSRMCEAAAAFQITQFGLSCFQLQGDGSLLATTFNAYIFPQPPDQDVLPGVTGRKFCADADALSFLSGHGFDFNKWIKDGVPYFPARLHEEKIQQLAKAQRAETSRSEVIVDKPQDQQTVAKLIEQVVTWLRSDEPELELGWLNNGWLRLLAHQELARPRAWRDTGAPLSTPDNVDPGFYITKRKVDGWPRLSLVRGNRAEAEAAEAALQAKRSAQLQEAGGFSDVLRAMRACGKPCVGHNPFFDVAYVLATFIHGTSLPPLFADAKKLIDIWFPGGIYDTKQLARNLPLDVSAAVLPQGTALGDVYRSLTTEGPSRAAAEGLLAASGRTLPVIKHAPGSAKYMGMPAGAAAHEAGYDAMMTGASFACLERLLTAPQPGEQDSPLRLEALTQYRGQINLSKTDMPYLALTGPDAPLNRDHVLHVDPGNAMSRPLSTILTAAKVPGRWRITFCPQGLNGFLVELDVSMAKNWDASRLAIALSQQEPQLQWSVTTWEQYAERKRARLQGSPEAAQATQAAEGAQGTVANKRRRMEEPPAAPVPAPPAAQSRCVIS